MVKPICKDVLILSRKSTNATKADLPTAADLLDTLVANKEICVGMAANMIGVNRCIIAFQDGAGYTVMLNPKILQKSGAYETEEGCLSLTGVRLVKRWKKIKVRWQNEKLEIRIKTYTGWTAEIIQHEIDHCEGILI